jgi:hypothetical protein
LDDRPAADIEAFIGACDPGLYMVNSLSPQVTSPVLSPGLFRDFEAHIDAVLRKYYSATTCLQQASTESLVASLFARLFDISTPAEDKADVCRLLAKLAVFTRFWDCMNSDDRVQILVDLLLNSDKCAALRIQLLRLLSVLAVNDTTRKRIAGCGGVSALHEVMMTLRDGGSSAILEAVFCSLDSVLRCYDVRGEFLLSRHSSFVTELVSERVFLDASTATMLSSRCRVSMLSVLAICMFDRRYSLFRFGSIDEYWMSQVACFAQNVFASQVLPFQHAILKWVQGVLWASEISE